MSGHPRLRLLYRVRQFWLALRAQPPEADLVLAKSVLSAQQLSLFLKMQPAEQAHSLSLLRQLQAEGNPSHDLQVAALLHDAGKARHPLRLWERVWIVAAGALAPGWMRRCGSQPVGPETPFWQRPLAVACQHPEWGAQLAQEAGASRLAVSLIRRHQQKPVAANGSIENELLLRLQAIDDWN